MYRPQDNLQRQFQFTTEWCFVAVTLAALLIAINQWSMGTIWSKIAPNGSAGWMAMLGFAIAFVLTSVRSTRSDLAWGVLLVAWCFALIDSLCEVISSIVIINGQSLLALEVLALYETVLAAPVIPGLLSIPTVCLRLGQPTNGLSKATCWLTASIMVAMVDVVLVALFSVTILGVRFLRDGSVQWTFGPK